MKYYRPITIDEYFAISEKEFTLFAGGTDLMPRYERGQKLPNAIIDLKKIPDFTGIKMVGDKVVIGAGATIEKIKNNDLIKKYFYALWQATTEFGSVQIRNRATLGGNICNASPSGDTLPSLYAFGAQLILRSKTGERTIPIDKFIISPGETTIEKNEILLTVIIPQTSAKSMFYKLGLRETMAISVINFAIVYNKNELTIALGAVAPTIIKLSGLENFSVDQILAQVDDAISPIDDIRATANYRRKTLQNMLRFELENILNV